MTENTILTKNAILTGILTDGGVVSVSALEKFISELPEKALNLGIRLVVALILLFIGSRLIRLIRKIAKKSMEKVKADATVISFMDSFLKVALYVVLILMLAASVGVDAATIVALLGSAGVAIGLALQGSLSNLAGGVLIMLLKPFTVGDYIQESSTAKEGTVTEIKIFYTTLVTPDHKTVILPNGSLSNSAITNFTRQRIRRVDVKVSVSYGADLLKAKEVLMDVLNRNEKTLEKKDKAVLVESLGDNGVQMILRCWCKASDYWDVFYGNTEAAKLALDEAGIEIPFPQMDVHMIEK
jgi:small conductance mechanosensitive channel